MMLKKIDPVGAFLSGDTAAHGRMVSAMIELDEKKRIIQEFVPGKQVTLCHVIASPDDSLYTKLGLIDARGAIGIMTITPVRPP